MGPVSPGFTPSNAGFRSCCVVLAWTVGAGLSADTGVRGRTSKRGMGCVNAWTPNSGLRGSPVGMEESSAYALCANGLSPRFSTIAPAAVKSPSVMSSRRVKRPCDQASRISRRFRRAFSASFTRALDAFPGRYIPISPCRLDWALRGGKLDQERQSRTTVDPLTNPASLAAADGICLSSDRYSSVGAFLDGRRRIRATPSQRNIRLAILAYVAARAVPPRSARIRLHPDATHPLRGAHYPVSCDTSAHPRSGPRSELEPMGTEARRARRKLT